MSLFITFLTLACAVQGNVIGTQTSSTSKPSPVLSAIQSPTVYIDTYESTVRGNRSQYISSVYNFKAIPFASAPTGEYRWRHPQHVSGWTGIRNATQFAPDCPQPGSSYYSEDCLYLNIWTPDTATLNDVVNNTDTGIGVVPASTGSKLPVYVWFHGDDFGSGSARQAQFDGAGLAAKGIVVVTVNYRLGALGFLAHPELSNGSVSGTSGNYGLVDQQASLHWTNENIASFGGDPTRITIGGQSAGAASVLDHLNSAEADGLFEQVIAESGATYPSNPLIGSLAEGYRSLKTAEAQGAAYLTSLNLSNITQARAAPVDIFLAGARETDVTYDGTVFANDSVYAEPPLFRPVLDGYILPATYKEMLQRGNHTIAPVLTGGNKDENGATPQPNISLEEYISQKEYEFSSVGLADEFFRLYPAGDSDDSAALSSNTFYQDQTRVSALDWAKEYIAGVAFNTSGESTIQAYSYYWTHAPPGQDEGAYHGSEINYAFNNLYATDKPWTAKDYAIADRLSDYWVNFLRTGNPNSHGLPTWPATRSNETVIMELGDSWKPIPVATQERLAFVRKWFSKWPAY